MMQPHVRTTVLLAAFVTLALTSISVRAQQVPGPRAEMPVGYVFDSRLPAWCLMTFDGPRRRPEKAYLDAYGEGFRFSHHHCRGLYWFYEASKHIGDRARSEAYYARVQGEFDFILENTDPTYVLHAEALLYHGMASAALGDSLTAFGDYEKAVAIRPDYTAAYVATANLLIQMGDVDRARAVLESAVALVQDPEVLRTKLARLEKPD